MAQEFAKKFYKSKAWQQCRRSYIAKVYGLCERCKDKGIIKPGYILHHKIKLTAYNINDVDITLNHKNLKYTCKACHEIEHHNEVSCIREGYMFDELGEIVEMS